MALTQDVTRLACTVAHVHGWSDVEHALPAPHDHAQLLLRAPHHVGVLALSSSMDASSRPVFWHPHRRLTAACWLPSATRHATDESTALFAIGDDASTVRLARPRDATADHEVEAEEAGSTTILVDRDSLLSASPWSTAPAPQWAIRELLPIAVDRGYLVAQRAMPRTHAHASEARESAGRSGLSGTTTPVWLVSTEDQTSWSVSLPCEAAREDEVPVLMPITVAAPFHRACVPEVAVCSSQAITVCRGPSLSPAASFVFNTDLHITASRVRKLFVSGSQDYRYTALVQQQHRDGRSALWLAEWDARYPRTVAWWSSLAEGEASRTSTTAYHACTVPQRRAFAIAALPKTGATPTPTTTAAPPVALKRGSALFTVSAPSSAVQNAASSADRPHTMSVKPCHLDITPLFSRPESVGTGEDADGCALPCDVKAVTDVDNVLTFVNFAR